MVADTVDSRCGATPLRLRYAPLCRGAYLPGREVQRARYVGRLVRPYAATQPLRVRTGAPCGLLVPVGVPKVCP